MAEGDARAAGCGRDEGLEHVPIVKAKLRKDHRRVMEAPCQHRRPKSRARQQSGHCCDRCLRLPLSLVVHLALLGVCNEWQNRHRQEESRFDFVVFIF